MEEEAIYEEEEEAIYIVTHNQKLTDKEIEVLIEAFSTYQTALENEGQTHKIKTLLSAAEKLGLYSED